MNIIPEQLQDYIEQMSTGESRILSYVTRKTYLHQIYPGMISGKVQGKFLEMISRMVRPWNILEIGTFTAYSTICLAKGLAPGGKIITIEVNPELEDTIIRHLKLAGLSNKVQLLIGDALDIIPGLEDPFDLVFIDADKEYYTEYFNLAFPLVKSGGFILADNTLWGGKVVDDSITADKETQGIMKFNQYISECSEVENVIVPLRDGITLIRKK